jgi:hypothetical protein
MRRNFRWYFALDMRLGWNNTNSIMIGGNLFDLDKYTAVNFTDVRFTATSRGGDNDGINLPWFDHADSALLYWQIHRDDNPAELLVKAPIPGTIQFWPSLLDLVKGL